MTDEDRLRPLGPKEQGLSWAIERAWWLFGALACLASMGITSLVKWFGAPPVATAAVGLLSFFGFGAVVFYCDNAREMGLKGFFITAGLIFLAVAARLVVRL
jgi:hypothetical protein